MKWEWLLTKVDYLTPISSHWQGDSQFIGPYWAYNIHLMKVNIHLDQLQRYCQACAGGLELPWKFNNGNCYFNSMSHSHQGVMVWMVDSPMFLHSVILSFLLCYTTSQHNIFQGQQLGNGYLPYLCNKIARRDNANAAWRGYLVSTWTIGGGQFENDKQEESFERSIKWGKLISNFNYKIRWGCFDGIFFIKEKFLTNETPQAVQNNSNPYHDK